MTRTLFTAQKNEGPFIVEWVAYHRVIGFERIIVYSNGCTDGSDDLLDALAGEGMVEHFRHDPPEGTAPQMNAARLAMDAAHFKTGDWVMWLDLDEFLVVKTGARRVADLIEAIAPADAIAVNWRIHGDSGHATFPGRQIGPHFTRASKRRFWPNSTTKTLYRFGPHISHLDVHRPVFLDGERPDYVDGGGRPVPDDFFTRTHGPGQPYVRLSRSRRFTLAQINHFIVRTPDRFRLKAIRGRGAQSGTRHTPEFYDQNNRNEVEDTTILHWLPALDAEIAAICARLHLPPDHPFHPPLGETTPLAP